jgi:DNA polymerase-3 subunit epsilon
MRFINAELEWARRPLIPMDRAVDTLEIARRKFPGAGNSLDALCRRFGVNNAVRTLHGALLDSELLAEVYLELIGGRQPDFGLAAVARGAAGSGGSDWTPGPRPRALEARLTEAEAQAHEAFVAELGDKALWTR